MKQIHQKKNLRYAERNQHESRHRETSKKEVGIKVRELREAKGYTLVEPPEESIFLRHMCTASKKQQIELFLTLS
jgi:hypothetical protein